MQNQSAREILSGLVRLAHSPDPYGYRSHAVGNNVSPEPANGSRSAKIHPEQPWRTEPHGNDPIRCLSRVELRILGALPKPGKDLLRPAAAGTHTDRNLYVGLPDMAIELVSDKIRQYPQIPKITCDYCQQFVTPSFRFQSLL